jgi:hypothetical protein
MKFNRFLILSYLLVIIISSHYEAKLSELNFLSGEDNTMFQKSENGTWKPIRIKFVHGAKYGYVSAYDDQTYNLFEKTFLSKLKSYFSKFLKIYPLTSLNKAYQSCSTWKNDLYVPKENIDEDRKDADFVFYILPSRTDIGALMEAATCSYVSLGNSIKGSLRPLAGYINLSPIYVGEFYKKSHHDQLALLRSAFHEITHALAFSPSLFSIFIDEDGNSRNYKEFIQTINTGPDNDKRDVKYLSSPKWSHLAQNYYNCPAATGFPLDLQSSGHFWSLANLQNEMLAMDSGISRTTEFLAYMFEFSGWYIVNTGLIEKTIWGRGKGCNFWQLKCTDENGEIFPEYCKESDLGMDTCDFTYDGKARCSKTYLDRNPMCVYKAHSQRSQCYDPADGTYKQSWEFYGEEGNTRGKCVESTNNSTWCLKAQCDAVTTSIKIYIGSYEYSMNYENDIPRQSSFSSIVGLFRWPESYERFCYSSFYKVIDVE